MNGQSPPIDMVDSPILIGSDPSCHVKIMEMDQFCMSLERMDEFSGRITAFTEHLAVNNKPIPINISHQIFNGDTILLDKRLVGYGAKCPSFFFVILHDHLKRKMEPLDILEKPITTKVKVDNSKLNEIEAQREKADENKAISEELHCGICLELIHNCVTLTNCLHNYCGGCISEWLKKKNCPLCKAPITIAKKNAQLNNIVKSLLNSEPSKQRPVAELALLDEKDLFKNKSEIVLKQRGRGSQEGMDDRSRESYGEIGSFEDEDELGDSSYTACPECSQRREGEGFLCPPDGLHLECRACSRLFPNREASHAQRCTVCQNAFCSIYLPDCRGFVRMKPLKDHPVAGQLCDNLFRGNKPDLDVV